MSGLRRWARRLRIGVAWAALCVLLALVAVMAWTWSQRFGEQLVASLGIGVSEERTYTQKLYTCSVGEGWVEFRLYFDLVDKAEQASRQDKGWKPRWGPAGTTTRQWNWFRSGPRRMRGSAWSGPPPEHHRWTYLGYIEGDVITISNGRYTTGREWSAPGIAKWHAWDWNESHSADGSLLFLRYSRMVEFSVWIPGALLVLVAWPAIRASAVTGWRLAFRRHKPGMCPNCGYDLRATPERCPECGRVVTDG